MQQRTRKLALFLTGSFVGTAVLLAAACGTDNGTTPTPGTPTADAGTGRDSGDGPNPSRDGGPGEEEDSGGVDADCSQAPRLRTTTNGFFCAFYRSDGGGPDGGSTSNCANDEICCNPSGKDTGGNFHPSFCAKDVAKNGDVTCAGEAASEGSSYEGGGSAWECADKNQCGASEVCCLIQDPARLPNQLNIGNFPKTDEDVPPACNAKRAYNAGGSRCRTSCQAGEIKMCSLSDDNCSGGSVCTPFEGFFRDLGYCFP